MSRSSYLVLHRWIGLALVPFLMVQALTGALLVLHAATLAPPPGGGAPPVTAFLAGAQNALPGFRVTRLYLPGPADSTGFAELAAASGETAYAALDPATGRATRSGGLWRFPYRFAVQLHYRLASGTLGMAVVLAVGIALALSAASGFAFWWPGRRRVRQALIVRRGLPARLRLRQWHRTCGALVAIVALFSAVTGILLIIPDIVPAPAVPATAAAAAPDAGAIDRAVAAAQARFPGADLRDVRFPKADRIDINFAAPEFNARAVHAVSVRPSDGAVLKSLPASDNPVLWMKVLPLHTGQSFGPAGLVLLLAEATALAFLAHAGARMWLAARKQKRKAR